MKLISSAYLAWFSTGWPSARTFGLRFARSWVRSIVVAAMLVPASAFAIDPPHATTDLCASCHMPHQAPGGSLSAAAGNPNLCMSCHQSGGAASSSPFANSDQALPWSGLPALTNATGTSHRWDASAAGHVDFLGGASAPSTGSLVSSGLYTGAFPKTYTITIATAGAAGTARFNWVATSPGGGSGTSLLTGANSALDQGVQVSFSDGPGISFQLNDRWNLYVRAGLSQPTNAVLLAHMVNGVAYCSACHDEHDQSLAPFDPSAPAYAGPGTGNGRHFMRVDNDHDQMCNDCHQSYNVPNSAAGSHPVAITLPVDATHRSPTALPMEQASGTLGCLTCHKIHHSPTGDAKLLRLADSVSVCVDCHTQSDTATPAAHLAIANSNTLWPGGKNGSLLPARTNPADRGACLNCHPIHGWPDTANPANHYPKLLADFEENLCYTCHGATGPAVKQVQLDFAKAFRHPVANAQQVAGRKVECNDCHNSHKALAGSAVYTNTATAARNTVANAPSLAGTGGVAVDYTGLGNFVAPAH
ncbi:MAG: cytochrome c3 family protein [Verrucomicrobiota bacterium]